MTRRTSEGPRHQADRTTSAARTGGEQLLLGSGVAEGASDAPREGGRGDDPRGAAPRVRLDDPMALFVPASRVDLTHQAVSLRLLQVCPGTLRNAYERDAAGMVVRLEDRYFAHTLHIGGIPWQIEVHADQRRGRVSMQDWDFCVAIYRLWAEGGVGADGTVTHATYRGICRAANRPPSDENIEAAKRAFGRWAGTSIHVSTSVPVVGTTPGARGRQGRAAMSRGPEVRGGGSVGGSIGEITPGALTDSRTALVTSPTEVSLFEREGTHWILEYDVEREVHAGGSREAIDGLRINPRWLQDADWGAAFLNVELFLGLERMIAKRLLQIGTLRATDGSWRTGEPWAITSHALRRELGIADSAPFKRTHESFLAAFRELEEKGALRLDVQQRGRTEWEYEVHMGPSFLLTSLSPGIRPYDPPETRRLLWHLRAFGLSGGQARRLVQEYPQQTLEVLRRAFWLLLVHGGRGGPTGGTRPVQNWGRWITTAITEEWSFTEPAYRAWVQDLANGRRTLDRLPAGAALSATAALATLADAGRSGGGAAVDRVRDSERARGGAGDATAPEATTTGGVTRAVEETPQPVPAEQDPVGDPNAALLARVVAALCADVGDPKLVTMWCSDLELRDIRDGVAVLRTGNAFAKDWLLERYGDRLCALLSAAADAPVGQLRFELAPLGGRG